MKFATVSGSATFRPRVLGERERERESGVGERGERGDFDILPFCAHRIHKWASSLEQ